MAMEKFDKKAHWEHIYSTKALNEVSWYQPKPMESLMFVEEFGLQKDSKIIDIGGGDSLLVDHLLDRGFTHITVLDISAAAIERAKARLGEKAARVNWIVADAAQFRPQERYDFWHDRAAFHFLTEQADVDQYLTAVKNGLNENGVLVVGTFSESGPTKCSGIQVKQYSEASMTQLLEGQFSKIRCIESQHKTPFETIQNFVFCSFRPLAVA